MRVWEVRGVRSASEEIDVNGSWGHGPFTVTAHGSFILTSLSLVEGGRPCHDPAPGTAVGLCLPISFRYINGSIDQARRILPDPYYLIPSFELPGSPHLATRLCCIVEHHFPTFPNHLYLRNRCCYFWHIEEHHFSPIHGFGHHLT